MFLQDTDYTVQIRNEIANIIDNTENKTKLLRAESMAIGQIKQFLAGRFDCDKIFIPVGETEDNRNPFIVMITIDILLYHVWSKEAPNKIPKHRELRYNDALEWLKEIQKGAFADLPLLTDTKGEEVVNTRIWSEHNKLSNRY